MPLPLLQSRRGGNAVRSSEMMQVLTYISGFYEKFTVTEEKTRNWMEIFKNYEYSLTRDAVTEYASENRYSPVAADIRRIYWELVNKRDAAEQERRRQEHRESGNICEWCNNVGWFRVFDKEGYSSVAPCICSGEQRALAYYKNHALYHWDKQRQAFVWRKGWVGDEPAPTPVPVPAQPQTGQASIDFGNCCKAL